MACDSEERQNSKSAAAAEAFRARETGGSKSRGDSGKKGEQYRAKQVRA